MEPARRPRLLGTRMPRRFRLLLKLYRPSEPEMCSSKSPRRLRLAPLGEPSLSTFEMVREVRISHKRPSVLLLWSRHPSTQDPIPSPPRWSTGEPFPRNSSWSYGVPQAVLGELLTTAKSPRLFRRQLPQSTCKTS